MQLQRRLRFIFRPQLEGLSEPQSLVLVPPEEELGEGETAEEKEDKASLLTTGEHQVGYFLSSYYSTSKSRQHLSVDRPRAPEDTATGAERRVRYCTEVYLSTSK